MNIKNKHKSNKGNEMLIKQKGFSLIELLIATTIGTGIAVTGLNMYFDSANRDKVIDLMIDSENVVKAVGKRLSIDGYNTSTWNSLEWANENLIYNELIKDSLTSQFLASCSGGGWTPIAVIENEVSILPCNLWQNRTNNGETIKANLTTDTSGFIKGFNLIIKPDFDKTKITDIRYGFLKIKKTIGDDLEGTYNYGFSKRIISGGDYDIESITTGECIDDPSKCLVTISYDRAGGAEYLRLDGQTSMINSYVSFIESRDNAPLKCARWSNTNEDGSGIWNMSIDDDCGIGIYNNTSAPVVVDVLGNTGTFKQVVLDEECIDYRWNGTTIVDNGTRSPCGTTNDGTEIYQTIPNISANKAYIESAYLKEIYTKNLIVDTVTANYVNVKESLKTDLIEAFTTNGTISVNDNMTIKEILYAEKDFYVVGNTYMAGNNVVTGDVFANGDIISQGSVTSTKELKLLKVSVKGLTCSDNGSLSRETDGSLLVCVSGVWDTPSSPSVPIGTVSLWANATVPTGWLEMNGQSTAAYPDLRSIVGNNVPDLRGQFVRAWDHGKGIDVWDHDNNTSTANVNRSLNTTQLDAMQPITGSYYGDNEPTHYTNTTNSGAFYEIRTGENGGFKGAKNDGDWGQMGFDSSLVTRTADETRPVNYSLMYIIKAE